MKCIDAIEGTVKTILQQLLVVSIEQNLDDSEYVRNVKAVIDATERFIQNNPEVVDDPELIKQVLYVHSRNLWLVQNQGAGQSEIDQAEGLASDDDEYQTYYYDYLYNRGNYPL